MARYVTKQQFNFIFIGGESECVVFNCSPWLLFTKFCREYDLWLFKAARATNSSCSQSGCHRRTDRMQCTMRPTIYSERRQRWDINLSRRRHAKLRLRRWRRWSDCVICCTVHRVRPYAQRLLVK